MIRKTILKTHFVLIAIVLLNYAVREIWGIGLLIQINFILKLAIVGTGLISFFLYLKPFIIISGYLSIYPIAALITLIAFITRNSVLGLLVVLFILHPVVPVEKEVLKKDNITVYQQSGFLSRCCIYKVTEKRLFIFEKEYGIIDIDGTVDIEKSQIQKVNNKIEITYLQDWNERDTTIILPPF